MRCNTVSQSCYTVKPILDVSGAITSHQEEMKTHITPLEHQCQTIKPVLDIFTAIQSCLEVIKAQFNVTR